MIQDLEGLSRFDREACCFNDSGPRVRRDHFLVDGSRCLRQGPDTAPRCKRLGLRRGSGEEMAIFPTSRVFH
jgi:hypothetical protein